MKIFMEEVLKQFEENKGINSYLEAKKPSKIVDDEASKRKMMKQPFNKTVDEMGDKKLFKPAGKSLPPAKEPIENYVWDALETVAKAIKPLISAKKINSEATKALKQFCKNNKLDYDEMNETLSEFVSTDIDKDELDITALYFLGGI